MSVLSIAYLYQLKTLGNEFSVLNDFLETLDEVSFSTTSLAVTPSLMPTPTFSQPTPYILPLLLTPHPICQHIPLKHLLKSLHHLFYCPPPRQNVFADCC
ncbi:hypothetical protein P692DRAFT_20908364 [Suillus brevipes Sb2]|nr:hypothetical protein P692DRAFT_20908364 [Suillus brevipes Sb2]